MRLDEANLHGECGLEEWRSQELKLKFMTYISSGTETEALQVLKISITGVHESKSLVY